MGLAPNIEKHWGKRHGLPATHQLGTVMYETAVGQLLCAECASGRNGSKTRQSEFGHETRWDVVRRRFTKAEPWGQCDHCRKTATLESARIYEHEEDDENMPLVFGPDKHHFDSRKKPDLNAVAGRLRDIFTATGTIRFVATHRSPEGLPDGFIFLAHEKKISAVDRTDFSQWIQITPHVAVLLGLQKAPWSFDYEVQVQFRNLQDRDDFFRRVCDELHVLVLSDANLPVPNYEFQEDHRSFEVIQDGVEPGEPLRVSTIIEGLLFTIVEGSWIA